MSFLSVHLYTEYALDIDKALKTKEKERIPFNFQSPEIVYRQSIVTWIRHAAENIRLSNATVHLAVYLLDIFMDNHGIVPERLYLVTIVCLLLAAKIEELDINVPKISDLSQMIKNKYPVTDFICLEFMVIKFLKWNLILPTAVHFAEYYMSCASTSADLKGSFQFDSCQQLRHFTEQYLKDFLDQSLMDIRMHHFPPSLVAASCIAATRQSLSLMPKWTSNLMEVTGYQLPDLQPCLKNLLGTRTLRNHRKRKMTESPDHGYETGNSASSTPNVTSYKRSTHDQRNP